MARLGTHELSILRLGCYELQSLPHIPALAIISEYAAIAEEFNADTGFINAVLDQLARHFRALEMESRLDYWSGGALNLIKSVRLQTGFHPGLG